MAEPSPTATIIAATPTAFHLAIITGDIGQPETTERYYRDEEITTNIPLIPRDHEPEGSLTTVRYLTTVTHDNSVMTHYVETVSTVYPLPPAGSVTTMIFTVTSGGSTSGNIHITTTVPAPPGSTTLHVTPAAGSKEMSTGATIGAAVGAAVGIIGLALLGFYAWWQHKRRKAEKARLQAAQMELMRLQQAPPPPQRPPSTQQTRSDSLSTTIAVQNSDPWRGYDGGRVPSAMSQRRYEPPPQNYQTEAPEIVLKPGTTYVPHRTRGYLQTPSSVADRRSEAPDPYAPTESTEGSHIAPPTVWEDMRPDEWRGMRHRAEEVTEREAGPGSPLAAVQRTVGWVRNGGGSGGARSGSGRSGGTERPAQPVQLIDMSPSSSPRLVAPGHSSPPPIMDLDERDARGPNRYPLQRDGAGPSWGARQHNTPERGITSNKYDTRFHPTDSELQLNEFETTQSRRHPLESQMDARDARVTEDVEPLQMRRSRDLLRDPRD
ncbi:hypothetical protein BZA05DRAFT_458725 [Tricharina praecox]|uniref:uncharacterized protein n=1 Tax=Tricharina praecox TaxID=43433 RepID=UPI00221F52B0|nr:uncharacterized protein BZA05DRAFT_458725 [Tricharina praecox]KAI5845954.1 hypothetical protein BZA05DRAFT_458725 [Tricharina praecox]